MNIFSTSSYEKRASWVHQGNFQVYRTSSMENIPALEPREGAKGATKGEWQKGDTICVILTVDPFKCVSILRAWMSEVLDLISFL